VHTHPSGQKEWRPRPQQALDRLFKAGYGHPTNMAFVMRKLQGVAQALTKGDRSLAAIALVHAALPALPDPQAMQRMTKADRLLKLAGIAHDVSNQPRIPAGQPDGGEWANGDFEAYLQRAGFNPRETELLRQLYKKFKDDPAASQALMDELKDLADVPAAAKSFFDPPKSFAQLMTDKPPGGFPTWPQLRAYLGPPPPGYHWHHIIEQSQDDAYLNSPEGQIKYIQNTANVVLVPTIKHYWITARMGPWIGIRA